MHASVYVCVGSFTSGSKRYWVHGLGSYVVMTTDYNNVTYPPPLLPSPPLPFFSSPPLPSPPFPAVLLLCSSRQDGQYLMEPERATSVFNSITTCTYNMCACVCVCVLRRKYLRYHLFKCMRGFGSMDYTQCKMGVKELAGDPWPPPLPLPPSPPLLTPHCAWHKCVHLFYLYACVAYLLFISIEHTCSPSRVCYLNRKSNVTPVCF